MTTYRVTNIDAVVMELAKALGILRDIEEDLRLVKIVLFNLVKRVESRDAVASPDRSGPQRSE